MIRSLTSNFRRLFSSTAEISTKPSKSPLNPIKDTCSIEYKSDSVRTGALGIKKGMMSYWDSWGKRHPVTILHVKCVLLKFTCFFFLVRPRASIGYI